MCCVVVDSFDLGKGGEMVCFIVELSSPIGRGGCVPDDPMSAFHQGLRKGSYVLDSNIVLDEPLVDRFG